MACLDGGTLQYHAEVICYLLLLDMWPRLTPMCFAPLKAKEVEPQRLTAVCEPGNTYQEHRDQSKAMLQTQACALCRAHVRAATYPDVHSQRAVC